MITIHHLNNSRSQRIIWLLEELDLEYEIKKYQRDSETMLAPPELLKIHPLGKSPVITDGESTVAESGVIVEYLLDKYSKDKMYYPKEGSERINLLYWIHFAEASLMPPFLLKLVFDKIKSTKMPFFVKPIANKISDSVLSLFVLPNIKRNLKFVDDYLKDKDFFCGSEISGADIMMSFPLEAGLNRYRDIEYKNIERFLRVIHERSAYKKAIEVGGEYSYS